MIRAVFFDIDGTLITNNNRVLPSTIKSIECLQKKGYIVGIATSRGPNMLPHAVKKIPFDYWVTFNGQLIYDKQGNIIYSHPLDEKDLNNILLYINKMQSRYLLQSVHKNYGSLIMKVAQSEYVLPIVHFMKNHLNDQLLSDLYRYRLFIPNKKQKKRDVLPNIYQVTLMQPIDEDGVLQNKWESLTVTRSNPFTVEIISREESKANGIQRALAQSNLSLNEVLFFGDNYNDIEVMRRVKYGVAMGNGIPELREDVAFVTRANDKDGIYYALRYFHLIDKGEI